MNEVFNKLKEVYKLDMNKNLSTNFVGGEIYSINDLSTDGILSLKHDLFYEDSFIIKKINNSDQEEELFINIDYVLEDVDLQASLKNEINSKIYSKIKILNKENAKSYKISYHVYGDRLKAEDYNNIVAAVKDLNSGAQSQISTLEAITAQVNSNSQKIEDTKKDLADTKTEVSSLRLKVESQHDETEANRSNIFNLQSDIKKIGQVFYFNIKEDTPVDSVLNLTEILSSASADTKILCIINPKRKLVKINSRQINTPTVYLIKNETDWIFKEEELLIDFEIKKESQLTEDLFQADYMSVKIYEKIYEIRYKTSLKEEGRGGEALNKLHSVFYFNFNSSNATANAILKALKNPITKKELIYLATIAEFNSQTDKLSRSLTDSEIVVGKNLAGLTREGFEIQAANNTSVQYQGIIRGHLPENY